MNNPVNHTLVISRQRNSKVWSNCFQMSESPLETSWHRIVNTQIRESIGSSEDDAIPIRSRRQGNEKTNKRVMSRNKKDLFRVMFKPNITVNTWYKFTFPTQDKDIFLTHHTSLWWMVDGGCPWTRLSSTVITVRSPTLWSQKLERSTGYSSYGNITSPFVPIIQ